MKVLILLISLVLFSIPFAEEKRHIYLKREAGKLLTLKGCECKADKRKTIYTCPYRYVALRVGGNEGIIFSCEEGKIFIFMEHVIGYDK